MEKNKFSQKSVAQMGQKFNLSMIERRTAKPIKFYNTKHKILMFRSNHIKFGRIEAVKYAG